MEISGNGIYDNRDCGIVCSGCVDITENDVVGNQAGGIIVDNGSVTKVCWQFGNNYLPFFEGHDELIINEKWKRLTEGFESLWILTSVPLKSQ